MALNLMDKLLVIRGHRFHHRGRSSGPRKQVIELMKTNNTLPSSHDSYLMKVEPSTYSATSKV